MLIKNPNIEIRQTKNTPNNKDVNEYRQLWTARQLTKSLVHVHLNMLGSPKTVRTLTIDEEG